LRQGPHLGFARTREASATQITTSRVPKAIQPRFVRRVTPSSTRTTFRGTLVEHSAQRHAPPARASAGDRRNPRASPPTAVAERAPSTDETTTQARRRRLIAPAQRRRKASRPIASPPSLPAHFLAHGRASDVPRATRTEHRTRRADQPASTSPPKTPSVSCSRGPNTPPFIKQQPGYISTRLHRGIAGSSTFIDVAVWESAQALGKAFGSPEFQAGTARYPDSTVATPHLAEKIAVAGICVS
jgi:hypothetical protein